MNKKFITLISGLLCAGIINAQTDVNIDREKMKGVYIEQSKHIDGSITIKKILL